MPLDRIVPPIRGAGAAVVMKKLSEPPKTQKNSEAQKTFFKGATSLVVQAEPSTFIEKHDSSIRGYLGIENTKHNLTRNMSSQRSALNKIIAASSSAGKDEKLDPRHFTRSVLEQCQVLHPITTNKKPMLYRGSSIARICEQNPTYAKAL